MNWPASADMLIRTGWAYGVPTREIAQAVGMLSDQPEPTRDAVIGRAHRIGLPRHPLAPGATASSPRPPAPAAAAAVAA